MPLFIASLWGGLISIATTLVGKVLIALGIGYVSYTGLNAGMEFAKTQFLSAMSGLPADAIGMASTLKIGVCVSMLLSALSARLVLAGLQSVGNGTVTKMVQK